MTIKFFLDNNNFLVSLFALLSITLLTPSYVLATNIALDDKGYVEIPIDSDKNAAWFIINKSEIDNKSYKEVQDNSIFKYRPKEGYGDIFYYQKHSGVKKEEFYLVIIIDSFIRTMFMGIRDSNKFEKSPKWKDHPLVLKNFNNTLERFLIDIKEDGLKGKIINLVSKAGEADPDPDIIKSISLGHFAAINSYPPESLFVKKKTHSYETITYAARRDFTNLTFKVATIYLQEINATTTCEFISFYPSTSFLVSEEASNFLDRLSIDVGIVQKSSGDQDSQEFNDAGQRYMFGGGIDLGKNVSFMFGVALYPGYSGSENAFYIGISLDLLNLFSKASK